MNSNNPSLFESAQCAQVFLDALNDPKRDLLPLQFFRALVQKTLNLAKDGVNAMEIKFDAYELAEAVLPLASTTRADFDKKSNEEKSKWVRDNWKLLLKELESRRSHLEMLAVNQGLSWIPWIEKEDSSGGNGRRAYYRLTTLPLGHETVEKPTPFLCPDGGLRYVPERVSGIPPWAKWIQDFTLRGWWRIVLFFAPMLMLIGLVLWIGSWMLVLLRPQVAAAATAAQWLALILSYGFTACIGVWIFARSVWPLYAVIERRIVMAPGWLLNPLDTAQVTLEFRRIVPTPEQGPKRKYELRTYSGHCPVCGDRVEIERGGLEFPFRLIGRCEASPREHVFSFDHVTMVGKPLR